MKLYRLYGPMDIRCTEKDVPSFGDDEVLLKTEAWGVCGSDIARVLKADVPFLPSTLGHELSATVEAIGKNVQNVKVGDLVAVAPLTVCHKCFQCRNGNFGQCENRKFIGLRDPDRGGMAEYNVMPAENVIKLPTGISREAATMVEPLTVAIHAIIQSGFKPGYDVAVIGAGTIGQLIIQCVKAMGSGRVFAFDNNQEKLDAAKLFGTDKCYDTTCISSIEQYMKDTGKHGCPYVFEAVGLEQTIQTAIDVCAVGGTVGLVGLLGISINLPAPSLRAISFKQISLKGVWQSYSLDFPGIEFKMAIDFLENGRVCVDKMIYKVETFDKMTETFEEYKTPGKVKGKIIFVR